MRIVPLEGGFRALAEARAGEVLAQYHPLWIDIMHAIGERAGGLAAIEGGELRGWIMYVVREGRSGTVVSSMPYTAYGGPAVPKAEPVVARALLEGLRELAGGADVLCVGTSPFTADVILAEHRRVLAPTWSFSNFVQLSDLSVHPLDALPSRKRDPLRRKIAAAAHLSIERGGDIEDWIPIYRRRYAEIGATPYPDAIFPEIARAPFSELWVVRDGERFVGGTLFLASGGVADYFSSAFDSDYRELAPNTALLARAFDSFRARGFRKLNWQSSPGKGGVYEYKRRWGAVEGRHDYLSTLISDGAGILGASREQIQRDYPLRFVVPFSELRA